MEYFFLEDQLLIDVEDINLLKKYSWSISGAGYVQTSTRPSKFLHRLILKGNRTINKGGFKAEIEAAQYYDELAEILFGEFARFNFL